MSTKVTHVVDIRELPVNVRGPPLSILKNPPDRGAPVGFENCENRLCKKDSAGFIGEVPVRDPDRPALRLRRLASGSPILDRCNSESRLEDLPVEGAPGAWPSPGPCVVNDLFPVKDRPVNDDIIHSFCRLLLLLFYHRRSFLAT